MSDKESKEMTTSSEVKVIEIQVRKVEERVNEALDFNLNFFVHLINEGRERENKDVRDKEELRWVIERYEEAIRKKDDRIVEGYEFAIKIIITLVSLIILYLHALLNK